MQRYEQKTSKIPLKWKFSPTSEPKIFLQKLGSFTFVPLWYRNWMPKVRKDETSLEILKDGQKDYGRTDKGHW